MILSKLFSAVSQSSNAVSGINKVLGLVFGVIRGAAIVFVLLVISSLVANVPAIGTTVYEKIQETTVTSKVFDYVDNLTETYLTKDNIGGLIEKITSSSEA